MPTDIHLGLLDADADNIQGRFDQFEDRIVQELSRVRGTMVTLILTVTAASLTLVGSLIIR
jgi:hypothetical protein